MAFGITPTGFNRKTVEQIKLEIEEGLREEISSTLDLSSASPMGQIVGIVSSKLGELWEIGEAAYDAMNPDNASGFTLTAVSAITGTLRRDPTKSTILCTVNLDAATYAAGSLIASVVGQPDSRFVNVEEIVAPGGDVTDVKFEAESTGPLLVVPGTLTVIAEPVVGWNSVVDTGDVVPGTDVESDPALRTRRVVELATSGSATVDAIRADVEQVEHIQSVVVLENNTDALDSNGLPPHSFEVIVFDGLIAEADDDEIAQAIWDSHEAGIASHGTLTGTAVDSLGANHTMRFTRVEVVDIYLTFELQTDPIAWIGNDAFKALIAGWGDANLSNGEDVVAAQLIGAAISPIPALLGLEALQGLTPGVIDVTSLKLGFAPAPSGTSNLVIGVRQIANIETANIDFV